MGRLADGASTRSLVAKHVPIPTSIPSCRATVCLHQSLLQEHGFAVTKDWLPTAIAFRHSDGREIDLHPIEPTPDGGGPPLLFIVNPALRTRGL